jgi:hypothetical protein
MTDKANIAAAAIAKLEAEKQRRLEEKIGKGHAILIPCDQALVIGGPEGAEAVVAEYKARELAKLRAAGETREVVFEEPMGSLPAFRDRGVTTSVSRRLPAVTTRSRSLEQSDRYKAFARTRTASPRGPGDSWKPWRARHCQTVRSQSRHSAADQPSIRHAKSHRRTLGTAGRRRS